MHVFPVAFLLLLMPPLAWALAAILVGAWAAGCIVQWLNLATRAAQGSIWRDPIVGDQAWRFATREREDDRAAARSEA